MSTISSSPALASFQTGSEIDPQALARLFGAIQQHDLNGEEASAEELQTSLARGRSTWWAIPAPQDPARLVGYGYVFQQTSQRIVFYLAVHPDWRRQGLGSRLLERIREHARQAGAGHITTAVNITQTGAGAFLGRQGLRVVGSQWQMHLPAAAPAADPVYPPGFRVERYSQVDDRAILTDICNRSRHDMWGHSENTPGAVTLENIVLALNYWGPDNIFLAFAPGGEVAGVCSGKPNALPQGGHLLDAPTLAPEYRACGLHRPLLLSVAQALRACAPGEIRLESYGDPETTIAIYREAGFVVDEQDLAYGSEL